MMYLNYISISYIELSKIELLWNKKKKWIEMTHQKSELRWHIDSTDISNETGEREPGKHRSNLNINEWMQFILEAIA